MPDKNRAPARRRPNRRSAKSDQGFSILGINLKDLLDDFGVKQITALIVAVTGLIGALGINLLESFNFSRALIASIGLIIAMSIAYIAHWAYDPQNDFVNKIKKYKDKLPIIAAILAGVWFIFEASEGEGDASDYLLKGLLYGLAVALVLVALHFIYSFCTKIFSWLYKIIENLNRKQRTLILWTFSFILAIPVLVFTKVISYLDLSAIKYLYEYSLGRLFLLWELIHKFFSEGNFQIPIKSLAGIAIAWIAVTILIATFIYLIYRITNRYPDNAPEQQNVPPQKSRGKLTK